MADAFFTTDDGEWFVPTDHSRGPWDVKSCHAGPPTGLLARALEGLVPEVRLVRLQVDLVRPVPMAGFRIEAEIGRRGRTVSTTRARLVDGDEKERATATGLHIAERDLGEVPTAEWAAPVLAEAVPGPFVLERPLHGRAAFMGAVQMRYPPGEDHGPGPTTVWMRTVPLLGDEKPSPFQRICPLADCGNAIGRNANPEEMGFVNPDLTVVLHRDPVGEWLGSSAVSHWQASGVGLADALLFDEQGAVGRALQTLVLTPA